VTEYEVQDVEKANATGKQPVVFVHGLWLPAACANKSIGQIADHYQEVIEALDKEPAIIGTLSAAC
jgi:non-heme chloroperoxidase